MSLSEQEEAELYRLLVEEDQWRIENKWLTYFPDTGPLRRELYAKHIEYFSAGLKYRERAAMAGNRIGKTEGIGAYEVMLHLTGLYPDWWPGRRFDKGVNVLCGGDTGTTTRDIIVSKLLGPAAYRGSGMIPKQNIIKIKPSAGIPDGVDYAQIKHVSGDVSIVQFRSYDQGREAWQGTERDVVWCDEEPPEAIYTEGLLRTATTKGMMMATFTPLRGLTDVALSFMPQHGGSTSKYCIQIDWDDVPHLTKGDKEELLAAIPPYQRDARTRGIPALGSGVIYPVPESTFIVEPFEIPRTWPVAYGLDVGWNRTAATWGAYDRASDVVYIYSEHYVAEAPPQIHADSIKARGVWIPGAIDPASAGSSQLDGRRLIDEYRSLGLDLSPADNAVEAGIMAVYRRLSSGRLKIFRTCVNLVSEMRLYRRDEKGKIVKERDHAVDGLRYLIMSGMIRATTEPFENYESHNYDRSRSGVTGY
jgi:phage terminase large subunit-like protein